MKSTLISVLFVLVVAAIIFFFRGIASAEDMFSVTLIDVGKGDCILIRTGSGNDQVTVMVDTGYAETAGEVLKYLSDHGIQKLDAMIISHFHKDHVGGAAGILSEIPVGKVYMPDYEGTRKVYKEMMDLLEKSGSIPYERLKEKKSFSLGGAEYHLYPSRIEFDGNNDNDVSMAMTLEYNGHTALFAGDLEKEGVSQFLNNKEIPKHYYDILKMPHHGAEEDNTDDLLERLKPGGIVVITDGQDKRAHGVLLDTLENDGFRAFCSADDGTITITADPDGYSVEQAKDPEDCSIDGDWKYIVDGNGSAVITGYTGSETDLTLPSEIAGYPVKAIGDSAFYNQKSLKRVTIPEGVEAIGSSAFSWCTALENVSIPDSALSIGDAAFYWCTALENITIPDSVASIGTSGFEHCSKLENAALPAGLTAIAPSLFERCSKLKSIDIPDGVKSIGKDAFKQCTNLTGVSIPESVTLIDEGAFKRCDSLESIDIPESVTAIEESAFESCISLKNVIIPDSVTSLGKSAFQYCENLVSAEIGKGVNTIKKSTFAGCVSLKSVNIPDSVKSVKGDAFLNCRSLTDIHYAGTTAQWDALSKDKGWDKGTPADKKIHCSDSEDDPEPEPDPDPDIPAAPPEIRFFRLDRLPGTGFSAGQPTALSIQPKDLQYIPSGLTLQIPSLDVSENIVSIPFRNGEYPVEWLENNIGLPEEFSAPGSGPSILVGHNHLSTSEAGPFALLQMLTENSQLFITDRSGRMIRFSVFANAKISADDMEAVRNLSAACENSLILITCEDEKPEGGYASRRIVAARPAVSGEEY